MFDRLRSLLSGPQKGEAPAAPAPAPEAISAPGGAAFAFAANLDPSTPFPIPDWNAVEAWMAALPDGEHVAAWGACERAWLLHMRDAMGPGFRLEEGATAMVLSSLAPADARRALEFMERTLRRIVKVLDGVAVKPELGKDLLILFEEPEAYYEYASIYHPEGGEFALSSGMHITQGCGHYISLRHDLTSMEPVIAHEMTHGCLSHLPLPLWLNEGLAVNTEHRVTLAGNPVHTAADMRRRHLKFWGPDEVQQFWSGKSFRRQDEGNELSYDLARILVEQLSADWPRFASFARAANYQDGGAAAAREHLGLDLGDAAAALLEAPEPRAFHPDPSLWREPAEWIPQPA